MLEIIEQAAARPMWQDRVLNLTATNEGAAMESIALSPEERKNLIRKMKRERKPSRRLRMHIVLLAADGRSPSEIARTLYCSRTTVYTITRRFAREGEAAFEDRKQRGPPPKLHPDDQRRLETLVEEAEPWAYGWVRSRWSCLLLAWQLLCERGVAVSRETRRCAAPCTAWALSGAGPVRSLPQRIRSRNGRGCLGSCRCCKSWSVEKGSSSKMSRNWSSTLGSASCGCAAVNNESCPRRGRTASCGSAERSIG